MGYLKVYKIPAMQNSNAKLSLANFIELRKLIASIKDRERKELLASRLNPFIYLWDFAKQASKHLKEKTFTFILFDSDLYYGQIELLVNDENGEISTCIGWRTRYYTNWKNVAIYNSIKYKSLGQQEKNNFEKCITCTLERNFFEIDKERALIAIDSLG